MGNENTREKRCGVKRMILCPSCGCADADPCSYDEMLVVRPDLALFKLKCPSCGAALSALHPIPAELREEVQFAAIEVGAGMGMEG